MIIEFLGALISNVVAPQPVRVLFKITLLGIRDSISDKYWPESILIKYSSIIALN